MPKRSASHAAKRSRNCWLALPAALLHMTLSPGAEAAQQGFAIRGSVALVESYDDNILSTPGSGLQDVVSRVSPRVAATYQSGRFGVLVRYALDAEAFSRHPELSTPRAAQAAGLDVRWSPASGLAAASVSSYEETHTPGQLDLLVGLEHPRALARRFSTTQSLSRRLGARTSAAIEHGYVHEEVEGALASDTHRLAGRIERQVGPVDSASIAYSLHRFAWSEGGSTSHTLAVGWARDVTPRAHLELKAGPRLSGSILGLELAAVLHHRFRRGEAALSYVRTETTVVGQPAPITAEAVHATFTHQLMRSVTIAGGPGIFQATRDGFEATIYRGDLELTWRLSRHLALAAGSRLSLQRGGLVGRAPQEIVHNAVLLRLVAGSIN